MSTGTAVPGTNVPSGVTVSPGGAQGIQGLTGPGGPNVVSTDTGNQSKLGSDSLIYTPGGINGFISKTAAYTLTLADRNKYVICSGGSWTLTLPAAAVGLCYNVRNDQGISGTTGTITLQPAAGTIDGLASIALLPQQECLLISDGTNWRSFGLKREVILGTQDITTSTANGVVLLPVGYRYFELKFTGVQPVTVDSYLSCQFSTDGGATWLATLYYTGQIRTPTTTTVSNVQSDNVGSIAITPPDAAGGLGAQCNITLYPGSVSSAIRPSLLVDGAARQNAGALTYQWKTWALQNSVNTINAFQYYMSAGNIATSFLTVKGIV